MASQMAEVTWHMRDHRNSVNYDNERATMSIEDNNQISVEYNHGFGNLGTKLAQQPRALLMTK